MNQDDIDGLIASLNEIGEPAVRERIAKGTYRNDKLPIINHWLDTLAGERAKELSLSASEAAARKEEREVEQLVIARDALSSAKAASLSATSAAASASDANEIARSQRSIAREAKNAAYIAAIAAIAAAMATIIPLLLKK